MATQRPARVLLLIKGLGIGGAEKLISEGARHWDRTRFNYEVAYMLPWKDQLVGELAAHGVAVHMVGTERGLTPASVLNVRRLIKELDVNLVHAHSPTMGILCRIVSPVPVVYTEHNVVGSYRPITRAANRLTYRRNAAVIAVSDAVAQSVATWNGPDPVVIPNGVSAHVTREEAAAARVGIGLSPDDTLVVHVGNIRPGKGHDNLIEATRTLVDIRADVRVVSIGAEKFPGDLDRVRRQAHEAGLDHHLQFLGRRPDALAFVGAADAYVSPSDVEGLPVAILEAMSLAKPVAATAVGGVPSIINDGQTGRLVDPGEPEDLARAIADILDNPALAGRMGSAAQNLVERRHGLETMVRATEDLYDGLLNEREGI